MHFHDRESSKINDTCMQSHLFSRKNSGKCVVFQFLDDSTISFRWPSLRSSSSFIRHVLGWSCTSFLKMIWDLEHYSKAQINHIDKVSSVGAGETLVPITCSFKARKDQSSFLLFHKIHCDSGVVSVKKTTQALSPWSQFESYKARNYNASLKLS